MTNVFEQAIIKEDGTVDFSKALQLAPDFMIYNIQNVIPWVMNMLAETKLSEEFIRKNFDYIPFGPLVIYNDIPQDLIEANNEAVFSKMVFDIGSDEFDDRMRGFFQQGYDTHMYDSLIEKFFIYFQHDELGVVTEEEIGSFSLIINAYCEKVSKEFLLNNIHEAGYLLLGSAIKRDDITYEDLINNLEDITIEEIVACLEIVGVDALDEDEEDDDAARKYNMLLDLLKAKADQSVLR
jgi:hypothetical protein